MGRREKGHSMSNDLQQARERVLKFTDEWRKLRGNDHEEVYSLHLCSEREARLLTADLELLVADSVVAVEMIEPILHHVLASTSGRSTADVARIQAAVLVRKLRGEVAGDDR